MNVNRPFLITVTAF